MATYPSRRGVIAAGLSASLLAGSTDAQPGGFALPPVATRTGATTVRGRRIAWWSEAGESLMRNSAGQARATIFSVAYLAQGAAPTTRPVTFLFNGGPSAPARGLREGLAPRVTKAGGPRGFSFVDNPYSPIDASDLVFVDPPGAGYSRMLTPDSYDAYWGIEQDALAISDFMAAWLESHGRLGSPVFIVGQSYGGTRAPQAARVLAMRSRPIALSGMMLISPTLGSGNENPMAGVPNRAQLTLPTLAAVAHVHGKGAFAGQPLQAALSEARAFADGPYAEAVALHRNLAQNVKADIAAATARLIGLPAETILAENLFVPVDRFRKALLPGRDIALSDGRLTAPTGQTADPPTYDIAAAIDAMSRNELGYTPTVQYVPLSMEANSRWNNTITILPADGPTIVSRLCADNPRLHVRVVGGAYDLNVPYALPTGAYSRAGLPPERFSVEVYPAGHAVFSDEGLRPRTTSALVDFYRRALA